MKPREVYEGLVDRHAALGRRLEQIDQEPMTTQYPQTRGPKRLEAAVAWKNETLAHVTGLEKEALPAMRAEAVENVARVQADIAAGRVPGQPAPGRKAIDPTPWESGSDQRLAEIRRHLEMMDAVDRTNNLLAVSNAIALANLQSSQTLLGRVNAYSETAGSSEFDWPGWSVDRQILPAILESRSNDDRAALALELLPRIEGRITERLVPDSGEIDQLAGNLANLREALEAIGSGGQENLGGVQAVLGPLARALARQAVPAAA